MVQSESTFFEGTRKIPTEIGHTRTTEEALHYYRGIVLSKILPEDTISTEPPVLTIKGLIHPGNGQRSRRNGPRHRSAIDLIWGWQVRE